MSYNTIAEYPGKRSWRWQNRNLRVLGLGTGGWMRSWLLIKENPWAFFSFSALLRYNRHVTLCKFKVYNQVTLYMYVMQNDYHNQAN